MVDIKLASWVKGDYLDWVAEYLKEKHRQNQLTDVNTLYIGPESILLEVILYREETAPKIKILEHMVNMFETNSGERINFNQQVPHKPYQPSHKKLNVGQDKADRPNPVMSLIFDLLIELNIKTPHVKESNNAKIKASANNLRQAMSTFFSDVEGRAYTSIPEYVADLEDRHFVPLDNPVQTTNDVLHGYVDTLVSESLEDPLFLSNNGKPSLKLYRIRMIVYSLILKTNVDVVRNTKGIYSLIAYFVGLSLAPTTEKTELLQANEVKKQVDTALDYWVKYTPNKNGADPYKHIRKYGFL